MKEIITQVKTTISLNGSDYCILCSLQDDERSIWKCEFPKMTLFVLAHCIVKLFESELLKAETLTFVFKEDTVSVKKLTINSGHKVKDYLLDISEQIFSNS